jgi:hypothetical protein|tara:strand:+ start:329 stop:580 length:252 start_codon:yes stop_codon:yes gene_type:complete
MSVKKTRRHSNCPRGNKNTNTNTNTNTNKLTACLLSRLPLGVEAVGVDSELSARVDGVVHELVGERLFPRDAELRLELVFRDW